jgi:hypothetical protein
MEIRTPVWHLKTPRCVHCHGNGALCFSTCPGCGHIVLVCDEVGHVYMNPLDLSNVADVWNDDPSCLCPHCGSVPVVEFRHSTGEEIQHLGIKPTDYA